MAPKPCIKSETLNQWKRGVVEYGVKFYNPKCMSKEDDLVRDLQDLLPRKKELKHF